MQLIVAFHVRRGRGGRQRCREVVVFLLLGVCVYAFHAWVHAVWLWSCTSLRHQRGVTLFTLPTTLAPLLPSPLCLPPSPLRKTLTLTLTPPPQEIFTEASLPLFLRPYEVLVTSNRTALIEMVPNAPSIHMLKARSPPGASLRDHFAAKYIEVRAHACEGACAGRGAGDLARAGTRASFHSMGASPPSRHISLCTTHHPSTFPSPPPSPLGSGLSRLCAGPALLR
jgi:hypothetical protein